MTFMTVCRRAAHQESVALRAYARAGMPPPRCRPVDMWDEWQRQQKTNTSSFAKKAA